MATDRRHRRYLLALVGMFLLIWGALAINPFNRHDWLLENLLVVGLAAALLLGHKHYLPSRSAATLIFFSYGLLLAYPMREVLIRLGIRPGIWSLILPIDIVLSTSAIYELIEWAGAEVLDGGLGRTFLATQNDRWDPQKDMALAAGGALIAMIFTGIMARARRPHRESQE